jgi:hypothetical protein
VARLDRGLRACPGRSEVGRRTCITLCPAYEASISPAEFLHRAKRALKRFKNPKEANNGFIETVIHHGQVIAAELVSKPWQVWEAPSHCQFVTSDNPIVTARRGLDGNFSFGWGFREPNTVVIFPLTPSHCLIVGIPGSHWREATPKSVLDVNRAIISCSSRWVYSRTFSVDIELMVNQFASSINYYENAFMPSDPDSIAKLVYSFLPNASQKP